MIRKVDGEIQEQDWSNKQLIKNLKKCIQSDQEAVKALSRKNAIFAMLTKQ